MVSLLKSAFADVIAWRSVQLFGVAVQLPPVSAVLVTVKLAASHAAVIANRASATQACRRNGGKGWAMLVWAIMRDSENRSAFTAIEAFSQH